MKTIFVINGFNVNRTATADKFRPLVTGLEAKGFRVIPVDISWRRKTPTQFTGEFLEVFRKHRSDYNIVLGNSFGSIVALLAAPTLQPNELYLCSISPFFKEDRGKLPDSYAIGKFGKRRAEDLWALSFDELAQQIHAKTVITYGENENVLHPELVERCKIAARRIEGATLHSLPGAPHSIGDKTYTEELLKLL